MGKKLATFLSFIMVGLGQIYNRQFKKAIVLWSIVIFIWIVIYFLNFLVYSTKFWFLGLLTYLLGIPIWIIVYLYNINDAYTYQKCKEEERDIPLSNEA